MREGRRSRDGSADSLKDARGDQPCLVQGEAAEERGKREQQHAVYEHSASAEQVAGTSTEQEQAAERERISGDHPLEVHR